MKSIPVIFIMVLFVTTVQAQDYASENLSCVYGNKHYTGNQDAHAAVEITSVGNGIEIDVRIDDDNAYYTDELVKSDHIELWFAMDTIRHQYIEWNGDLYDTYSSYDPQTPLTTDGFGYEGAAYLREDDGDSTLDFSTAKVVNDFEGMVHWGIDLKSLSAVLFDDEYYNLERPQHSLAQFVTVKKLDSTTYRIRVQPEAIAFFKSNISNTLNFMVDVVDADGKNNLSILSTSPKRKWAARHTFNVITLAQPLQVSPALNPDHVVEIVYYFYDEAKWNCYYASDQSKSRYNNYYPIAYDHLPGPTVSSHSLDDGTSYEVRSYTIETVGGYSQAIDVIDILGNKFRSEIYSECGVDDGYSVKSIGKKRYAIVTKDCNLVSPIGQGACGGCILMDYHFSILDHGKQHLLLSLSQNEGMSTGSMLDEAWDGRLNSINWADDFKSIIVETSEQVDDLESDDITNHRVITWDKNYKTKVSKQKKKP